MEISILSEAFSKNDVNSIVYIIVKPEELLVELWNEIRGRLQKIGFSKGKQCFFWPRESMIEIYVRVIFLFEMDFK